MEARLLPLAKLRAPRESIDGKNAWGESASERGLVVPVHFKSEKGEANLVVLDFVGVVAAEVVVEVGVVVSAVPVLDCCLAVIFLKEFFRSTLRSLCTLERCFLMVSRVRVMMPQMIHLYVMFW